VLSRPRIALRLNAASLERLRAPLAEAPMFEDPPAPPVSRDPKDDYLIVLAPSTGADALISGDRDLTSLDDVVPPVLSPSAFLERVADMLP